MIVATKTLQFVRLIQKVGGVFQDDPPIATTALGELAAWSATGRVMRVAVWFAAVDAGQVRVPGLTATIGGYFLHLALTSVCLTRPKCGMTRILAPSNRSIDRPCSMSPTFKRWGCDSALLLTRARRPLRFGLVSRRCHDEFHAWVHRWPAGTPGACGSCWR